MVRPAPGQRGGRRRETGGTGSEHGVLVRSAWHTQGHGELNVTSSYIEPYLDLLSVHYESLGNKITQALVIPQAKLKRTTLWFAECNKQAMNNLVTYGNEYCSYFHFVKFYTTNITNFLLIMFTTNMWLFQRWITLVCRCQLLSNPLQYSDLEVRLIFFFFFRKIISRKFCWIFPHDKFRLILFFIRHKFSFIRHFYEAPVFTCIELSVRRILYQQTAQTFHFRSNSYFVLLLQHFFLGFLYNSWCNIQFISTDNIVLFVKMLCLNVR